MLPPPHHTLMPFTKHLYHPLLPTYIASFFVTRVTGHKYKISRLPSPFGVKSSNLRSFLLKSHTYDLHLAAFQLTRLVIFNVPFRVISPGHWVPLTMPTPFNQRRQVKRPFPAGSTLSLHNLMQVVSQHLCQPRQHSFLWMHLLLGIVTLSYLFLHPLPC